MAVKYVSRLVPVDQILVTPHNKKTNMALVAIQYGYLMENPDEELAPVTLKKIGRAMYRIHDGNHRFIAYLMAGRRMVDAVVEIPVVPK